MTASTSGGWQRRMADGWKQRMALLSHWSGGVLIVCYGVMTLDVFGEDRCPPLIRYWVSLSMIVSWFALAMRARATRSRALP